MESITSNTNNATKSAEVVQVFTEGAKGEVIYQVTRGEVDRILAGGDSSLPGWIVERILKEGGPPPDPKAQIANRITELQMELDRLQWKTRLPAPLAARLLAIEGARREAIDSLLMKTPECKIHVGFADHGGPGDRVGFTFEDAPLFISIAPTISLDTATKELGELVKHLESNWARLHEEAERAEREFGQEYSQTVLQRDDDIPF